MKIGTLLAKHGLTVPQYRALTVTCHTKVVRVSGRWRFRGGSRPVMPEVIGRLAERNLVAIDETATPVSAVATPDGRALLAELEGRR